MIWFYAHIIVTLPPEMAGLYIHIPFCKSRCIYCGFYSTTMLEQRQRYVDAVVREMKMRCDKSDTISTIYLGGGTPSQLAPTQLKQLLDAAYIYNKVEQDAEITLEVNPDDVTASFAEAISDLPINRISMGVQTFDDQRLQFLHRRHSAQQVSEAIDRLRLAGCENISIDLMYGFPQETLSDWEQDIERALSLQVEHLSAYCLMIEEGTELWRKVESGKWKENTEEAELQMYYTLIDRLTAAGYEHYEISNFAQPGFRSRHNSSYWDGTPYIGLGASAHSYDIRHRSWNIDNIQRYIDGIEQGHPLFEAESIDEDTRYNDTVTVALRTKEGICLDRLSEPHRTYCLQNAQRFINDGLMTTDGHDLKLTRKGLFVSDMIMSELIWAD